MKKLLLTMAAALAVAFGASAISDEPIYTFDYNKISADDSYYFGEVYATNPMNTNKNVATEWEYFTGSTELPAEIKGVFSFAGGPGAQSDITAITSGISLIDLGGEIGQVLCVNGNGSKVIDVLTAKTNKISAVPAMSWTGWMNLNWTIASAINYHKIRVAITYTAYDVEDSASSFPSDFDIKGNLGGSQLTTSNTTYAVNPYSASNFRSSEGSWDGTIWKKLEVDGKMASGALRFQFNIAGNTLAGRAIFVKKVEFFQIEDDDDELAEPQFSNVEVNSIFTYDDDQEGEDSNGQEQEGGDSEVVEDNTTITFDKVVFTHPEVENYKNRKIENSPTDYPAYYKELNAFDLEFTLIPDATKVANGAANLSGKIKVYGSGGAQIGSALDFSAEIPQEDTNGLELTVKNVVQRPGYKLELTSVKYDTDEVETAKSVLVDMNVNGLEIPEVEFELDGSKQPKLYHNKETGANVAIFEDNIKIMDTQYICYARFEVSEVDRNGENVEDLDIGVLSYPFNIDIDGDKTEETYGLEGYEHRDIYDNEDSNYDDTVHNWSRIAAEKGYIPLHVAGIVDGTITRTIYLETPTINTDQMKIVLGTSADNSDVKIPTDKINFSNIGTKSSSVTVDLDSDYYNTQTSVANVAVDGNGKVEYFNLQGVSVDADALTPGLYIRRAGGKASKVVVK